MDTYQITDCLADIPNFLGVFPRDKLPLTDDQDFSLVANTDVSADSGRHWIAIVVRDGTCNVFCSLAQEPESAGIVQFCQQFPRCLYNIEPSQAADEVTCGAYAIFTIREMSLGRSFYSIVDHFHQIRHDDSFVRQYLLEHYGVRLLDDSAATAAEHPLWSARERL